MRIRQTVGCVFVIALTANSCGSRTSDESLSHLPVYQSTNFQFSPGEKLEYEVSLGLLNVGRLHLEVAKSCDTVQGKAGLPIHASARTLTGIKWVAKIKHDWHSWIDTATGNTLRMTRHARENGYQSNEEVDFMTDEKTVLQRDLDEPNKLPVRTERHQRQPYDLVNLIWKMRYTGFDKLNPGDIVTYTAYFDKKWYYFQVRFEGVRLLKWGGKKQKVFELVPMGTAARFLKGEEPARIFLESISSRRVLRIELSTYFGGVALGLISR